MMSFKVLALALLTHTVSAATPKPPATLYTKEPCAGETYKIPANKTCTLLPENLRKHINGAKLPEDVVCDFYSDEKCQPEHAVLIGVEDPGICSFSEWEIQNQTLPCDHAYTLPLPESYVFSPISYYPGGTSSCQIDVQSFVQWNQST